MRIKDMQRRLATVGELRLGGSVPVPGKSYNRPVKLPNWKITVFDRVTADAIAAEFGGKPVWWEPQNGGLPKWAVQTETKELPVVIPPVDMVEPSTSYEMWDRGQPKRRCDGVTETITGRPCVCGPNRASGSDSFCKRKMRAVFMLADVISGGVFKLESSGFYAVSELPTMYDQLQALGGFQSARLLLKEEKAHKPGEAKPRLWMKPVLLAPMATSAQLTGMAALPAAPSAPAIEAVAEPEAVEAELVVDTVPELAPSVSPELAYKTTAAAMSKITDDRGAAWMACLEAANLQGHNMGWLMEEFRKKFDKSLGEATAIDFTRFRDHITGAAT